MADVHIEGLTDAVTEREGTTEGGNTLVSVRVSETYDLSTEVNKISLIGIHTPNATMIAKLWDGFFKNYKFLHLDRCDVALACASMLPADPQQVGLEAGDIAPQDMFNPILYTACSNDSFNQMISRIHDLARISTVPNPGSIDLDDNPHFYSSGTTEIDHFKLYYGLLSDPDSFRKAMPQAGLQMSGLRPIVFPLLSQYGTLSNDDLTSDEAVNKIPIASNVSGGVSMQSLGTYLKGRAQAMPRLPTTIGKNITTSYDESAGINVKGIATKSIPLTYVGAIIVPPAKLNKLYYRLKVTWTITFSEPRPNTAISSWNGLAEMGDLTYKTNYVEPSDSDLTSKTELVSADGCELQTIMQSAL